ncbi:hypothetical protein F7O44_11915 [Phytoactinopolyspora sp. XMNu-373]|uniref:LPXTG cell wall anchor domain-containing protein n=1 Tax=Phytoactinopolyspora mesophila TaxID=2650750 RepID=A0A7K3M4D9_9ACTN|nr:hypothetical protein [Phytoactinopolyspora mesophila]
MSKTSGLDPEGETITVSGSGFDLSKGIYVALCVDNGAGQAPTPCLGGVDMEGSSGSSAWISSNPPSYGEGLAEPFDEVGGQGSFSVQLTVAASDEFTDCLDPSVAPNGCVVGTRADHTRTGDRSADVRIPVTFGGSGSGSGSGSGEDEAGSGGQPGNGTGAPATQTPTPSATGATNGATPGAEATTAGAGDDLARTGAAPALAIGAAVFGLIAGTALMAVRRRTGAPL